MPSRLYRYRDTRKRHSRKKGYRGGSRGKGGISNHKPVYPPKEINGLISHVIYINLDKRKDRKKHIQRELAIFNPEKVTRLPAVVDEHPTTGCAKSHLKALQMARDNHYSNVLIVEDDSCWNKVNESYPVLERLLKEPYDGILLGGTLTEFDEDTLRLRVGWTTSGYIVKEAFYQKYIELYEEALAREANKNSEGRYILADEVSNAAYKNGKWYLVSPALMKQKGSYSNIDMEYKNLSSGF
jgi:hypothetical protein